MVSEFAMSMIEKREREHGVRFAPRDVVRMNALGLKVEALKKKHARDTSDYLPRVAAISKTVSFRQPTIGHEIWIGRIDRLLDPADYQSSLAIKAFALSRPCSALPDPDDPKSVTAAIERFCAEMSDFTRDQIYAAIDYAVWGADDSDGELPAPKVRDPDDEDAAEPDGWDEQDWKRCVAVGVLREGQAVLFGVSQAEMEAMPRKMLEDVIHRAYIFHNIPLEEDISEAEGDFYTTLDEIVARLEKEKQDGR